MRIVVGLIGIGLVTMCGCSLISSLNYGEDLVELRREWEAHHGIHEASVSRESLPDLVKAVIEDAVPEDVVAPPKISLLSQHGDFLAYRVLFENGTEYHLDINGNQIEKPMQYVTHGGII